MDRQLGGDAQQVEAEHRHPAGAIGLVDEAAGRQGLAAVEAADVVESQEATLEDIASLFVLAIDPPGEVEQQLLKNAFEKHQVAGVGRVAMLSLTALPAIDLEDAKRRPGVHRRIDIAELPLVGR
jgi:hypothetical protein